MQTENNRAKLLLQEAHLLKCGWLMAPDAEEMSQKLGLLFGDQYSGFSNLLIPHFLNERIRPNGVLLQHTDDDGDPLEEAGFLLSDGDGVPLLKRLRGIRLDVLKALAQWCSADDLVRMIDGEPPAQTSPQPAPAPQEATEPVQANQSDRPTIAGDCLPPAKTSPTLPPTTSDIAAAFDALKWTSEAWKKNLSNKPKWLNACIAIPGKQGAHETRWNPVQIGAELIRMGYAKPNQVRARFQKEHSPIKAWLEDWKAYEATYLDEV